MASVFTCKIKIRANYYNLTELTLLFFADKLNNFEKVDAVILKILPLWTHLLVHYCLCFVHWRVYITDILKTILRVKATFKGKDSICTYSHPGMCCLWITWLRTKIYTTYLLLSFLPIEDYSYMYTLNFLFVQAETKHYLPLFNYFLFSNLLIVVLPCFSTLANGMRSSDSTSSSRGAWTVWRPSTPTWVRQRQRQRHYNLIFLVQTHVLLFVRVPRWIQDSPRSEKVRPEKCFMATSRFTGLKEGEGCVGSGTRRDASAMTEN